VEKRSKRKKVSRPDLEPESQSGQQQRFNAILSGLQESGSVAVDELSDQLGVSVVTIRRDLDVLEQKGLLRRTHGGAASIEPLFYEPFKKDRSFQEQVERQAAEKRRIGRAAAALINPGETIAITPGTTTAEIIRGIPFNSKITVVTNTANIAMELSGVGGSYRQAHVALKKYGFSTRFVDIHNTIDNVASGHSAWAADAVDTYLASLGASSRAAAWQRIRVGYRSLNPPTGWRARRAGRRARSQGYRSAGNLGSR